MQEDLIESRFIVFAGVAALLVVSPGVAMAVVTRNAVGGGRAGALLTAAGINCGNSLYAIASALGLSIVFTRSPAAVDAVKLVGALYLGFLGVQSLWRATSWGAQIPVADEAAASGVVTRSRTQSFTEGLLTNLLHPAVALFYLTYVPQFIEPGEPHFVTFMALASVHIALSVGWLSVYGLAIDSLGTLLARPAVRRGLEAVTGAALVLMAVRFVFGGG